MTVNHVIAAINRILGKDVRGRNSNHASRGRCYAVTCVHSAAKKCLGYEPKVSFEDGLLWTVELLQERPAARAG